MGLRNWVTVVAGAAAVSFGACSTSIAAEAAAAPESSMHFQIQDDDIVLPTPRGLCAPGPSDAERAERLKAMMRNLPVSLAAILVRCDGALQVAAAPVAVIVAYSPDPAKITISRKAFVSGMAAYVTTSAGQARIQHGVDMAAGAAKSSAGLTVTTAKPPALLGQDDSAVYIGADVGATDGSSQAAGTVIEAMTLIKGRVMVYEFIAPTVTGDDAKTLLATTKAEAARFVAANEGGGAHAP